MENSNLFKEELELYLAGQQDSLNFRLLRGFGVPLHVRDSMLWVESVKTTVYYENIVETGERRQLCQ